MNRTASVDHARTKNRDGTGSRWARWRPRWGIAPRSRRGGAAARRRPGGYRRGAAPRGSLSRPTALADLWGRRTARAVRGATYGTRPRLGRSLSRPPITRCASPRTGPSPGRTGLTPRGHAWWPIRCAPPPCTAHRRRDRDGAGPRQRGRCAGDHGAWGAGVNPRELGAPRSRSCPAGAGTARSPSRRHSARTDHGCPCDAMHEHPSPESVTTPSSHSGADAVLALRRQQFFLHVGSLTTAR